MSVALVTKAPTYQMLSNNAAQTIGRLVPLLTRLGSVEEKLQEVARALSDRSAYKTVDFMVLEGDELDYVRHHQFSLIEDQVAQRWEEEVQTKDSFSAFATFDTDRAPLIYSSIQTDPRANAMERAMAAMAGLGSVLVIPLLWQQTVNGALAVSSATENAFDGEDAAFLQSVATEVCAILHQQRLVEDLEAANVRIERMQSDTVLMLAEAAEAYDTTTGVHLLGVRSVTELLGLQLGLSPTDAWQLGQASVLHDMGKVRLNRDILAKPGSLTAEERLCMQQHTIWGEALLAGREGFGLASQIARWHHERWDGDGYPDRLTKSEIPLEVAIVTVADSFDAMIRCRPYKAALSTDWAVAEVLRGADSQFNPRVAEALAALEARGELRSESLLSTRLAA